MTTKAFRYSGRPQHLRIFAVDEKGRRVAGTGEKAKPVFDGMLTPGKVFDLPPEHPTILGMVAMKVLSEVAAPEEAQPTETDADADIGPQGRKRNRAPAGEAAPVEASGKAGIAVNEQKDS